MKATLILVGRTNNELFAHAIADYVGRIGHYIPFKIVTIPELKTLKNCLKHNKKYARAKQFYAKYKLPTRLCC